MSGGQGDIAIDTSSGDDFDFQSSDSERISLRSPITDYVYENGRRYHAYHAGEYWGPNDEKSMDAMDILYACC
ncbi:hypothetical protein PHISP_01307 [Aspergillus sp. HF37]|nr:hypothetical protein PHISP_01307 [Aspergillus sp. HF37]